MKTVFKTGPGFYAANSNKADPSIPDGKMHVLCASVEVLEVGDSELDLNTSFRLLVAMAEGRPDIARALLVLCESINQNRAVLQSIAKQK